MAEGPVGAESSDRIRDGRLAKLEKLEASGVRAPSGLYFAHARAGMQHTVTRFVVLQ